MRPRFRASYDPVSSDERSVPTLRVESAAVYLALACGAIGAAYGFALTIAYPDLPLRGEWSFGVFAAIGSAVVAVTVAAVGFWRSKHRGGQEWRQDLASWTLTVNTLSVVVVHTALAFLVTYALFLVLSLGFIGLTVGTFWSVVFMAVTLGMTAYLTFRSVAQLTTQRMSSLLMAFIVLGTLTSMVTTPDPEWWTVHFSHLGTFEDLSSWIFNGTLIAGGLLVTTFAVYIAHDMRVLVVTGGLSTQASPRTVASLFVVMGVMLACVGIFPVDVSLPLHNLSATGMALMFMVLLISGPKLLRGMPRSYFVSAWSFLAAVLASTVLFVIGYFSLTAFEIVVFALIFGWISLFIRFLGAVGRREWTESKGET